MRQPITGSTTLAQLQRLLLVCNVRLELITHRLRFEDGALRSVIEDSPSGDFFFAVLRLTDFGDRRTSTHAALREDLAGALDESVEAEILSGSRVGRRLLAELDDGKETP